MVIEGVNERRFLEELTQFFHGEVLRMGGNKVLMETYHYEPKKAFADEWPEIYFVVTGKRT